jgi:YVTN family beta-propeller protein
MRRPVLILLGALIALAAPDAKAQAQGSAAKLPASAKAIHLPLFFEANQGQTDSRVHFMARSSGYTLLLTPTETVLAESKTKVSRASNGFSPFQNPTSATKDSRGSVIRMQLVGASSEPTMLGLEKLPGKVNYVLGNDPAQWRTGIPLYSRVRTEQVYPGVDLLFHGDQKQLEYDFVVAPGADPSKIAFRIRGAARTEIDAHGDLVLHTADSDFLMHKPVIYQTIASERRPIEGSFVMRGKHEVAFRLGAYDHSQELVIDPAIGFSSYLGGSGDDVSSGFAVDDSTPGSPKLYLGGFTSDSTFPETSTVIGSGTSSTTPVVAEVGFVAKIDPTVTGAASLIYLTFLGGKTPALSTQPGCESAFVWLALDKSQGAANIQPVLGGITNCSDFPSATVLNPVTGTGKAVGFASMAVRLAASGTAVDKASTLGGNNDINGGFIAVGTNGNVILSGETKATNLPTKNAYVNSFNNGATPPPFDDCYVTILNRADLSISYLTYLNIGGGTTSANGVGCGAFEDASGNILAGGNTVSTNAFNLGPGGTSLANGFQTTFSGTENTFAMKLNPSLVGVNQLLYATYFGGGGTTRAANGSFDLGNGVVAIVGGTTSCSAQLPVCAHPPDVPLTNAFQASNTETGGPSGETGYVLVLDTTKTGQSSLLCSTYLGGTGGDDIVGAVTYDAGDPTNFRIIVGGRTTSASFPTKNPIQAYVGAVVGGLQSPDGFLSVLTVPTPTQTPFNASLVFSTYIGGSNPPAQINTPTPTLLEDDRISAVAVDSNHTIYAVGETNAPGGFFTNTNPTTTVNGFQKTCTSCNNQSPNIPEDDVVMFSIATGGNATLQSIAVTPTSATIAVGQTQQFRAVGNFSDGTEKDITGLVTWTTVPAGFATMSAVTPGLATGVAAGSTAVTPTLGTATVLNTGALTVTAGAAATHFSVVAPANATSGTPVNFTVTALDASNGTATSYTGTVHFTSSDGAATLPANSTLTNGTGTFPATLKTTGPQTITATDTVTATITGTSGTITVAAATPVTLRVTMAGTAFGTVTDNMSQINCEQIAAGVSSGSCLAQYPTGTQVTLTASTPGTFAGFSGAPTACTGTGKSCQVTVTAAAGAETVTATFTPGPGNFPLTIAPGTGHTGGGTIMSTPAGISCTLAGNTTSGTCMNNFPAGTLVNLTPAAGSGSTFLGWQSASCLTSSAVNCLVGMSAATMVNVEFLSGGGTVGVTVTGPGTVKDTANPGTINCTNTAGGTQTGTCTSGYALGTTVTLMETPTGTATFSGWTGASCANPTATTCSFIVATATPAYAVTATFAGSVPPPSPSSSVAVNPATNRIYATNSASNMLKVINGATGTTSMVAVGTAPLGVAVNPVTNTIYVANNSSGNVTVINGATNATSTVVVGTAPISVAVNPVTNKIYVVNAGSNNVTVIDGITNATTTVTVGTTPSGIALNPATNKIYVANSGSGNVTVIDGVTNATSTVAAGTKPSGVAVDVLTNTVYVANNGSGNVTVINGATNATATVTVGTNPVGIALDMIAARIYVANNGSGNVTVIDGGTNLVITTVTAGTNPIGVAVNTLTGTSFVTNQGSGNITVINGTTNATSTLTAGTAPDGVGVNPVTNKIYVDNTGDGSISTFDGATNTSTTVTAGTSPSGAAVNPATNKIYVANTGSSNVTVIDGVTSATTTVTVGASPKLVAVNPLTNKIYVLGSALTVIDGATNTTTNIPCGCNINSVQSIAVNPVTNKIYLAVSSSGLIVIDGATNATTPISADQTFAVAVNTATNKIYLANFNNNVATVVDGATNAVSTVPAGTNPTAVAVNPATNKIYVANNGSNNVTVIDGVTNTPSTVTDPNGIAPLAVVVNPTTNKIYVLNNGNDGITPGSVTIIDGATNTATNVNVGLIGVTALTVNPVTSKIYVANSVPSFVGPSNVTEIDGITNKTKTVLGSGATALAVNPVTNKLYASGSVVTVIAEQQVVATPPTTTIIPLSGNMTTSPTPTFSLQATTLPSNEPPVTAVYFQFDTWQGPWLRATSVPGGGFSATAPTLSLGTHILYAFSTDGQDGTSIMTTAIGGSSPIIGLIGAYAFTVVTSSGPGPATHFMVTAPTNATAGTAFNVMVTALDASNNTATGYTGTVHFTSTDGQATLPANSTLTSGVGTFTVTLKTAGAQTVTATDTVTATITGTSGAITVSAAAATHFSVTAPANATAGAAFNVTVTALTAANTTATGYTGTVHFTSSDGQAVLPANSTLTNGTGTFSVTLKTAGAQTITATDTVTATIMGSATVTVTTTAPTLVSITIFPSPELVNVGGTNQLSATGTFSDGSQQDLTNTAIWSSSGTTIATVSTTGVVTGVKAGGPVTIQATQAGIVGSTSLTVSPTFTGPYQLGELFASFGNGLVGVFKSDGTFLGAINTGQPASTGMAFDATGNLYVTTFSTPTGVVKIDTNAKLVGPFGSGYTGNPESIVFSHAGDAFVGEAQNSDPTNPAPVPVVELDPAGNLLATFNVARQDRGSDWVDLLQDQKTLLYTSEGTSVKSFDISKNQQNADFATNLPGSSAFALRQLPDGTVLVADSTAALRLTSAGAVQTTYTPNPASQSIFALNLDPDGTSFWTADLFTGVIYKFDIASGNQLTSFTAPSKFVSGLAIFGEKAPGQNNITVTENGTGSGTVMSQPAGINCPTVCVAPFTDNSAVVLTATLAQGSSFGGFSANCTPSSPQTNPPSCTVSLGTADVTISVTFNSGTGGNLLTVATAGTGTGTVTGNGINCMTGSANGCMVSLAPGTQVTLTANAASGSTFTSWSAFCESGTNVCAFAMPATATMITATFTLNAPTLKSIAVTPANPTEPTNSSLQFTATGTYSDNSTKNITASVTWSSSNQQAATINAAGLASTGATAGLNTTISATLNETTGSTTLTVSNSPISIVVTPPAGGTFPPVPPGGKLAVGIVLSTTEGFSGTVTFGCSVTTASGAPAPSINCVPDPSSVNVTPNGPTQVAFVVNTYCTGTAAAATSVPMPSGSGGGSGILLLGLALGGGLLMYRRNPRWALSFAVLALFALGGVACSSLPKGPNGATPPGNYLLKVTATTNGTTSSTPPIPFTVQ